MNIRQIKLNNAETTQKGEAKMTANTKRGMIPFNPAMMIPSMAIRVPTEVKMQASRSAERLTPVAVPASFHFPNIPGCICIL